MFTAFFNVPSKANSGSVESEEVELNRTAAGPIAAGVMRHGALPDSADFNWPRWLGNRRLCDRKVDIYKAKSISMFLQSSESTGEQTDREERDMAVIL